MTQEQYKEFYKQISKDFAEPLTWTHNRVEGSTEYTQLLYIPSQAPQDLWNRDKKAGIKLYVKRVFIMDEAEALMPSYLRFVKGVVDSADLPLNVKWDDALHRRAQGVLDACWARRATVDRANVRAALDDLRRAREWDVRSSTAAAEGRAIADATWPAAMAARAAGDDLRSLELFTTIVTADPTRSWARRYAEDARTTLLAGAKLHANGAQRPGPRGPRPPVEPESASPEDPGE